MPQNSERAVVRYEEREAIAIISIDRHDRLNTLTEDVVQGVADGIDAATASREVRAVVLRGEPNDGPPASRAPADAPERQYVVLRDGRAV